MHCNNCGFENPKGMRFCGQCASSLEIVCPACATCNPPDFKFCGHCAQALPDPSDDKASSAEDNLRAERRQLTVMFCDMVGSATLSEILDPEELRDVMRDYHAACNDVVSSYNGHVAQYLGDGILVYFGYPMAHEYATRRAVQAALEIIAKVSAITYLDPSDTSSNRLSNLQVRIGIHTGLVVVGEISAGDKRNLALGETPNISARVQSLAPPDGVVISETSHHLLGDDFYCSSLGRHQLKGFTRPLELFVVHNLNQGLKGSILSSHPARTRVIGRETETQLLLERLRQARKGIGQMVLLSGEPGMGKSRMVQTLYDNLENHDCFLIECCGTAYYQNSYLFPVIDMLRRVLHLHKQLSDTQKLQRLETRITSLGLDTQSFVPVLAELLSIPLDERYSIDEESTPQQTKLRTLDTLMQLLHGIAQRRLVLLIVEDLQWIDPSTLELLIQLARQPGLSNIFALFTFRNEFTASWPAHAHLTRINLNRLTREQSGEMIYELCQQKTLPEQVFNDIINKTDGIPFFIEELTNALLESKLMEERKDHFALSAPVSDMGIPSTLQDLLMARLDSLGDEKALAQISAILGREFDHEVLRVITSRDEQSFGRGLDNLISADLFLQQGQRPKAWYRFRHALLREAAYHSLLKRTRQKYHQRIARLMKEHFPQMVQENPELIANHFTEAGDLDEALAYWLKAGHLALEHSANLEAINHLGQGLAILENLPDSAHKHTLELSLQVYLGQAYMMTRGYAAAEVEQAYARAKELCRDISDIATVFPVLCGLWEYYLVRADLETALPLAEELHQLSQRSENPALILEARRAMGCTQFWRGQLKDAWLYLQPETLTDLLKQQTGPGKQMAYYQDSRVALLSNSGSVLWLTGHTQLAMQHARQALDLAKQLAHPFSQVYALNFLCTLSQLNGDRETTAEYAELQIILSNTHGFAFWGSMGLMFQAWANAERETSDTTLSQFHQALASYEKIGSRIARPYFLAILAELYRAAGNIESASDTIDLALEDVAANGEAFFKSELLRIKGELLLAHEQPGQDAAETILFQALELARGQGSHSLALRVANSLAELWHKQGKGSLAHELLDSQMQLLGEQGEILDQITARDLLRRCVTSD